MQVAQVEQEDVACSSLKDLQAFLDDLHQLDPKEGLELIEHLDSQL